MSFLSDVADVAVGSEASLLDKIRILRNHGCRYFGKV